MRSLISSVFKIMASVVIILIVSNVALLLTDIMTVVNRTEAVVDLVEASVMRDNYLSEDAKKVFNDNLKQIKEMSDYCESITLDEENLLADVKNYGEFATVTIDMKFKTSFFFWAGVGNMKTMSNSKKWYRFNIDKDYQVPCLRYLKYED